MHKALKKLRGDTGRVLRDLRRHLDDMTTGPLRNQSIAKLTLVSQRLCQQPKGSDKICALHAPEVGCISKGKARVRYEFGREVSITMTLEQVEILTDQPPDLAVVDRGYRGHGVAAPSSPKSAT